LGRGETFPSYRIDLDDVVISSVSNNGTTDQNGNLLEQITLNCSKITSEFREQDQAGNVGGSTKKFFDFRTGRGERERERERRPLVADAHNYKDRGWLAHFGSCAQ